MLMGYVAHRYQANAAMIRAACPANTIVLNGGCICAAGYMYTSYASVETTDATTQGTPIADGATTAGSWSCSCSSSSPTNSATVTCARIGN
jgi:hypothetical protein